ncbi:MAG TPA: permease-like cell division protein FtsX [Bradyrhizobium sp.]
MNVQVYFARHAQTLIGSLGRVVKQPFASLLTMGVIAVALALPLFLNLFLTNVRSAVGNWNDAFDLTVYIDKKAAAARTVSLAKQLRLRGDVATVRIVTADQAMMEFRENSGFGKALDALADNPLPDALVVTPTLERSTPQGTDALKEAIAALPDVQNVQLDTEWVQRLHALLDLLRQVVVLTGGLLGAGVVLIVGNTVRLDILNRRAEIEVMKLVGASDGFARRPFLYSGVWYGLGGGLIAIFLVAIAAAVLAKPVNGLAALYGSRFHLQGLEVLTAASVLGLAVSLAWLGSWLAATRHIRAIDPT